MVLACLALPANCAEISAERLHLGGNLILSPFTWSTLSWQIENPAARPFAGVLRCRPLDSDGDVLDIAVQVPAGARLQGRLPYAGGNSERYRLTLLQHGEKVSQAEILVHRGSTQKTVLLLGTGRSDLKTSDLSHKISTPFRVRFIRTRPEDFPENWRVLQSVRMLGVVHACWARYSARQITAIRRYVAAGGALVFLTPEAIQATAGTPLEDLLPVVPLGIRRTGSLTCFQAWKRFHPRETRHTRTPHWPDGLPVLACSPAGPGVTTLSQAGLPLCRWQRHGLGTVGALAFFPFDEELAKSGWLVPLWEHLLCWSTWPATLTTDKPARRQTGAALDLLTGYPIPSAAVIGAVLLAYIALTVWIIGAGRRFHRPISAAILTGAAGVLGTALILWAANRRAAHRATRILATVGWQAPGGAGEGIASVFSKHDLRVSISGANPGVFFTGFEPNSNHPEDRVHVHVDSSDMKALRNLTIRALRARRFCFTRCATSASGPPPARPSILLRLDSRGRPEIHWTASAAAASNSPAAAWLCRSDCSGWRVSLGPRGATSALKTGKLVRLDRFAVKIAGTLHAMNLPGTCLAVLHESSDPHRLPFQLSQDFHREIRSILLSPVSLELSGGSLTIPPELIRLRAVSPAARACLGEGHPWRETLQAKPTIYYYLANLPRAAAAGFVPERIEIHADIANPGGNVSVSLALVASSAWDPTRNQGGRRSDPGILPPDNRSRTQLVFTAESAAKAYNPITGAICLAVIAAPKIHVSFAPDRERLNRWKFNGLWIRVSGRLPKTVPARRF